MEEGEQKHIQVSVTTSSFTPASTTFLSAPVMVRFLSMLLRVVAIDGCSDETEFKLNISPCQLSVG
jgi:hypothetical protein